MSFRALALCPIKRCSISADFTAGRPARETAFDAHLPGLHAALQGGNELVNLERLLQIVERAELQRLNRAVRARIRRHDDDHAVGIVLLELLEERDAIHRLHVDVGEDEIEFLGLVSHQRLLPVSGERSREPCGLDDRVQHLVDGKQVVNN